MDTTQWVIAIGIGIGVVIFIANAVMRFKEVKSIKDKSDVQDERDARAIQRWAARESKRAK